jgi:hypothetical protein
VFARRPGQCAASADRATGCRASRRFPPQYLQCRFSRRPGERSAWWMWFWYPPRIPMPHPSGGTQGVARDDGGGSARQHFAPPRRMIAAVPGGAAAGWADPRVRRARRPSHFAPPRRMIAAVPGGAAAGWADPPVRRARRPSHFAPSRRMIAALPGGVAASWPMSGRASLGSAGPGNVVRRGRAGRRTRARPG